MAGDRHVETPCGVGVDARKLLRGAPLVPARAQLLERAKRRELHGRVVEWRRRLGSIIGLRVALGDGRGLD